jgi:DNA-binding beta-propeller fold protein YncE
VIRFTMMIWFLSCVLVPGCVQALTVRIECVAGCGAGFDSGLAKGAKLNEPFGIAFDEVGNGYICEHEGQKIIKVDSDGFISPFAGLGVLSFGGKTRQTNQASFNHPHGVVIARDQQMYVADTLNHRVQKINLKSGEISTIAGTGKPGFSGDGGLAIRATFNGIYAIDANQAADRIYLADLENRRVRWIDLKSGVVRTLAGNGEQGVPTDGAEAVNAPLVDPRAVTVDSKGNVYILERGGNALRMVDTRGKITTLVGPTNSKSPHSSLEINPDLNGPKHLCVDRQGNVIIADTENHLIRKYSFETRKLTVIAGTGEKGDDLVPDNPLKTQLDRPHGVFMHSSGALYISDSENNRILRMTTQPSP